MKVLKRKNEKPPFSLYTATVPVYIHFLTALLKIMTQAEHFAVENKTTPEKLMASKLAKDMFTFTQQVQYTYFTALDTVAHISGKEAPHFSYKEKTMGELKTSVRRTIVYLKTIGKEGFDAGSHKDVPIYFNHKKFLPAVSYVNLAGLPNFFFHYTTAYDILRHLGMPLKKTDYLGPLKG